MKSKLTEKQMKAANKAMILKALVDPKFRRMLKADAKKALGVSRLTKADELQIRFVLASVKGINGQISALADELLCTSGGCGIAHV